MKKFSTMAGTVALFAATLLPVIAAGNSCTNSTTGPFSNNTCTIKNTSNVTVNNVNDAVIVNNVTARSNTGNNSASMNTLGGTIVTGNATLNSTVSSVANINTTNVTGGFSGLNNTGSNEITGPSSNNTVWMENRHQVDVYNSNTATVNNNVDVTSNTGFNRANTNTGPASITTGDAQLGLVVANHVNDNLTEIETQAAGDGGNVALNNTTGPFSNNSVTIKNMSLAGVNNVNDLIVKNNVDALANSGKNKANTNTLGGDITTGGAAAGVGVDTEGNINYTRVAMAMGSFSNEGVNSVTGPAGTTYDPSIWIENKQEVVVDNWNNKCESHNADRLGRPHRHKGDSDGDHHKPKCKPRDLGVFNNVDVVSDTGSNKADTNTGGGSVTAGLADLLQQVLVHLNDSFTEISL